MRLGFDDENNQHQVETNNIIKFHGHLYVIVSTKFAQIQDNMMGVSQLFEVDINNNMARPVYRILIGANGARTPESVTDEDWEEIYDDEPVGKGLKYAISRSR